MPCMIQASDINCELSASCSLLTSFYLDFIVMMVSRHVHVSYVAGKLLHCFYIYYLLVFHSEVSLHYTERCDEEQEWK